MQLDTLEVSKSNDLVLVFEEISLAFHGTGTLIEGIGLYMNVASMHFVWYEFASR